MINSFINNTKGKPDTTVNNTDAKNEDLIFAKHIANEINKISDGRTKAAL